MNWRIPLTTVDLGEEEVDAVTRVIRGGWLSQGPAVQEFEARFADKLHVKHAVAVSSCTAALHIANACCGIAPGDEVICPALTFVASANAARYLGATAVFCGVQGTADFTIDPAEVRAKVSARTRAITVVHYAGFACRMEEILSIAREFGLAVIEDCAHAPFARYRFSSGQTQYLGTIGMVGCFSFFGNKNMTTGEGGMLTTNDDAVASRARVLRSHGLSTPTWDRHRGHASSYSVSELGFNYRMDEIRAAIGLCQLEKIDRLNAQRRQVYRWYLDAFSTVAGASVPFAESDLELASCHILPLLVERNAAFVREELTAAGVQTSRHYELVSNFPLYRDSVQPSMPFSADNLITLPLSPRMTRADVEFVAGCVGNALKHSGDLEHAR